ncbi:MAG: family 16 glycosylhydrolase, partial [Pseudomonadota bacterium]
NRLLLRLSPQKGHKNGFVGGSLRRQERTHYGRYEATLKAARGEGLVTGFFTYTGPSYGTRHDEIDFEFLGKDTTHVQVAYFTDGDLTEKWIPLGFDAADSFHIYAFEWTSKHIKWFVDGKLIHEVRASDVNLPVTPGRLFANIWAADASVANWAGRTQRNLRAQAEVQCLSFSSLDQTSSRSCSQ